MGIGMKADKRYVTPRQAAEMTNLTLAQVYNAIKSGELPFERCGWSFLIRRAEFERYVQERQKATVDIT